MRAANKNTKTLRYILQGTLGLGVVGIGVWGVVQSQTLTGTPALAQPQAPAPPADDALDEQTYQAVQRLRNELSLTNRDLRALGCDMQTATSCIASTLGWYESNRSTLHRARNRVLEAKKALYRAHRSGTPTETELRRLAEDLAQASQALEAVHGQAAAGAELALSADQRDRWRACRENRGVAGPLRYVPGLTQEQKDLAARARANGKGIDEAARDSRLSFRQEQALQAVRASLAAGTDTAALAEAAVLPMPQGLRQLDEGLDESGRE